METTWARNISIALIILGSALSERAFAQAAVVSPPSSVAASTRRVIVSLSDCTLTVVENGAVVRTFPVAVGAPQTPSPVGTFRIVNRLTNPGYYRPGKVIGPGPSNPLGTRWLGLDVKGYGIHGTDEPRSIGYARSHGCIRLRNQDVEQLFELLRPGDVVELRDTSTAELALASAQ
jgi:lipoprotein-anchoring transpeptidase ErfK/SrfK